MNHVQTQENRIKKFFLAVLLFFALGCILTGALLFDTTKAARADTQSLNSETNASLFLPASYENYLELSAPSSVAIGDRYVAVANGKKIYIYDHLEPSKGYRMWEHQKDAEQVTVGKMQFTDDDRLFFLSASGLYELTLNGSLNEKRMSSDFTPYTFLIAENTLYVVTVIEGSNTVLYSFEMNRESFALANAKSTITLSDSSSQQRSPLLAYAGGTVYCSLNGTVYKYKYNGEILSGDGNFTLDNTASSMRTPSSVCAIGDRLYFTNDTGLYCADTKGNAELIEPAENISALYPRGDLLYCLYGKAVRTYDTAANTFIDYEISSSSNTVNRLNGAKDIVRAGSLLVTADTNNNRISVYDMQKHSFDTISVDYSPTLVATDGEIIAAAADNTIYAYACDIHGNWDESTRNSLDPLDNVSGIACLFGKVYYTSATRRGVLGGTSVLNTTPKGLAANLYGDLFVAYEDGTVKRFTEETFTVNVNGDETNIALPSNFTCLRAEFDGKLYYLDGDQNLCMVDIDDAEKTVKTVASVDGKDFVYTEDVSKKPVSFALGFEDDEVYFCFGDFIVKSNAGALGLSTLETLSETMLKEAEDKLSTVQNAEDIRLADCREGAVGLHGDVGALLGGKTFSRKGEDDKNYKRYSVSRRGVVLDAQEKYSLVALYADHVYTVEIFRNEDLTEAFAPETEDAAGHEMYLASGCPSYHFPCIAEAPAQGDVLARGTRVKVLTVVHEGGQEAECGGYDFAYIEFETGARARMLAYVPYAYLTEVNPLGDTLETFTQGYVKPGVTFMGSDGSLLMNEERVSANLYKNDDGTYTAVFTSDGVTYSATVEEGNIEWGESDAIRIALIITLSVVAALIIGAYFFLLPREKKLK